MFVNGRQIVKFKAKVSEIIPFPLFLVNISKDFSISNATGLHGYVYDVRVDYKAIANDKIHDIHRYLIKKTILYKMFRVIKKMLAIMFLVSNINSLKYVLIKNQDCKVREVIINNDYMTMEIVIISVIHIPDVPNVAKNITAKVFDLTSWKNKTKQIKWHKSCKCVCRLDPIICNNKQKWNKDKCRYECLVNKKCDNKFVWNPSNCK